MRLLSSKKLDNCTTCSCSAFEQPLQAKPMRLTFKDKFEIRLDEGLVSVTVNEQFYRSFISRRFPIDAPLSFDTFTFCETTSTCASARFILCQMNRSLTAGERSEMYFESKVLELLFQILSLKEQPKKVMNSRLLLNQDYQAMLRVKEIISLRLDGGCPKICELAAMTHTCPAKLQKDFKTAFGCTVHEFTQSQRLSKAAELLAKTREPIYLIAFSIGCKKPGRFSEIFRAAYGLTPSEYREQLHG